MEIKSQGKNELKEKFLELRASGFSFAVISEKLGVSKPTLISWSRELSIEISNSRTLRMDELFQKFAVSKEKRVEAFGKRLDGILAELDKRNLEELKTETLLTLALKYGEMLRAENEPLTLSEKRNFPAIDFGEGIDTWQA